MGRKKRKPKIEAKYKKIIEGSDIASYSDPIEPIIIKQESPPRRDPSIPIVVHNPRQPSTRSLSYQGRRHHSAAPESLRYRNRPRVSDEYDGDSGENNFTVSIPNSELTAKDKYQLARFYGNK